MSTNEKIAEYFKTLRENDLLPEADDSIWKHWADLENINSSKDLIKLLTKDVRDSLKLRAIVLLLMPQPGLADIYGSKVDFIGKFYHKADFVKQIPVNLFGETVDIICAMINILSPMHNPVPKHVVDGFPGFIIQFDVPSEYHDALKFYNNYILELLDLETLPEEYAEKLFAHYSIRDISLFYNMEDCSGYNPLKRLMYEKKIDLKWKKLALEQLRNIVVAEEKHELEPRANYENALQWYAQIFNQIIFLCVDESAGNPKYNQELMVEQLEFLIAPERDIEQYQINTYHLKDIFALIADKQYKDLRHRCANFLLFRNSDKFSINDRDDLHIAQKLMAEFGEQDIKLRIALKSFTSLAKANLDKLEAERNRNRNIAEKLKQEVYSLMR
jgi:hypothetical protein